MRLALSAFILSIAIFAGVLAGTRGQLPVRLASHFNAAGVADGWMARDSYLWSMGTITLVLAVGLPLVFCAIRLFPVSVINLPRKDYWLGPERKEETFRFICCSGIWLGCLQVWFMLALHLLVVAANASVAPRLSSGVWWLMGGYLAVLSGWIFVFTMYFFRTPSEPCG